MNDIKLLCMHIKADINDIKLDILSKQIIMLIHLPIFTDSMV